MSLTQEAEYVGLSLVSRGTELFVVGEKYSRARDIHDQYEGTRQGGISPSGSHQQESDLHELHKVEIIALRLQIAEQQA